MSSILASFVVFAWVLWMEKNYLEHIRNPIWSIGTVEETREECEAILHQSLERELRYELTKMAPRKGERSPTETIMTVTEDSDGDIFYFTRFYILDAVNN